MVLNLLSPVGILLGRVIPALTLKGTKQKRVISVLGLVSPVPVAYKKGTLVATRAFVS